MSVETLNRLTKIAADYEKKHERKLMVSLVFDEMYIKQQIYWSHNEFEYAGWKNYDMIILNFQRFQRWLTK